MDLEEVFAVLDQEGRGRVDVDGVKQVIQDMGLQGDDVIEIFKEELQNGEITKE